MNLKLKIALIEMKQNLFMIAMLVSFAFAFGFLGVVASEQIYRINQMFTMTDWNADLAIVPKGISLSDLKVELQTGKSDSLLPLAIYETTSDLAKGQFKLSAALATSQNSKPLVMFLGERSLGMKWLPNEQVKLYEPQSEYSTAEWGTKVISAFFASGSLAQMQSLKDLVDRRTVAQALWVDKQTKKDFELQKQLQDSLYMVVFILLILFGFGFLSSGRWLIERLKESFVVLTELGFTKKEKAQILAALFCLALLLPFAAGAVFQLWFKVWVLASA